jgi:hypothetical protein
MIETYSVSRMCSVPSSEPIEGIMPCSWSLKVAILLHLMQRLKRHAALSPLPPYDAALTRDDIYFYSAVIYISVTTFRQVINAVLPNANSLMYC